MTQVTGSWASFWGELSDSERSALTAVGARRTFAPGKAICDRHETADDVVILRSGFAKVLSGAPVGPDVVLAFRGPGDIVGEMVGIGGGQRCATVAAIGPVDALSIGLVPFAAFLSEHAHATTVLQRTLVNKLREADRDRLAAGCLTVGQRLARLLLKLAQRYGASTAGGGTTIGLPLSQRDLAACIAGSARTVSRELEQWRRRGILMTGRRTVIIMRPQDLHQIAGPTAPP
jgi:CRP/FNR family transcriptional regulator, cyclic AMP receptor protein